MKLRVPMAPLCAMGKTKKVTTTTCLQHLLVRIAVTEWCYAALRHECALATLVQHLRFQEDVYDSKHELLCMTRHREVTQLHQSAMHSRECTAGKDS